MDKDSIMDSMKRSIMPYVDRACGFLSARWHEDASGKLLCIAIALAAFAGAPFVLANAAIAVCRNLAAALGILAWLALCCGIPALGLWLCIRHGMRNADEADSKSQEGAVTEVLES